ncbi:hypothetical protein [Candidatus Nitrosocosmicus hydrocola]|uniref:hypothetical protein n=1 Tax=Candidatus Nitrosocosmicus hydrocola TaxID=1826872 RepID=UPI0011E5A53A|nr:hypothetical protein [Candidatus Nitrosocosmicus hydrocola]
MDSHLQKRTVPMTVVVIAITITLLTQVFSTTIISNSMNTAYGHAGKLLNVNGKDYWIWVASIGEPGIIDVKGGAEAYIYTADPVDPLNGDSNKTKPVEGLDATLKFDVMAGNKNKTFDLVQVWNSTGAEVGHYESPFIHTVDTTYDYKLFGDWNGTKFEATWTCTPGELPEYSQTNETITLTEGVIQKAESGSFSCPIPISEISFPEPSMSNVDIQGRLNSTNTG